MHYIIETHNEVDTLTKLFMGIDNEHTNIEFYLERIRLAINNYAEYHEIVTMLADLNASVTTDYDLCSKLMNRWNAIVLQILYYILEADIQLPITEIHLTHRDLRLVTEGWYV